jgi:hypothetical protein
MKKLYSTMAAGVLLAAGAGSASAAQIVTVGDGGMAGWLSINNFNPGVIDNNSCGGALCMTLSGVTQSNGTGVPDLTAASTAGNPVSLFDPSLDLKFYFSNGVPTDVVPFSLSWNNADVVVDPSPLNLLNAAVGNSINIAYNGGWNVLNNVLPGQGTLGFSVFSVGADSVSLAITDGSTGGVSFVQALNFIDAGTSQPGIIDGRFVVPEPGSLALLSAGIAAFGFNRRQKAA